MRKLFFLIGLVMITIACNNVEKDYQACLKAEELYNQLGEKYEQAEAAGLLTPELKDSLEKEDEVLFEETKKVYAHFFENHINSPFAQKIFSETRWTRRLNLEQLESVVNQVKDTAFIATDAYIKAAERLYNMKTSVPGNLYKDIISVNPEGNSIALSEYVGKGNYILLDFWASWCPDCRKEMPEIVRLYEQYKDKNFEIVSYSLDKNKEEWIAGINKLGMTWTQMSDCDSWNSPAVKLYAVQFIPCTILIDPEGKILERGLSIDNLSKRLEELLK
jgi:thiol-disulfide isomerase/thioredoxin